MPSQQDSKYTLEILDASDNTIAEFSGRAKDRELTFIRNGSYSATWRIDLDTFQEYADAIQTSPSSILSNGRHSVRIKRLDVPLFAGQIVFIEGVLGEVRELEIRVAGWLDLLSFRYTAAEKTFTSTDAGTIGWTLIDDSQNLTNGDLGITQGTIQTSVNRIREYTDKKIKDALIELTEIEDGFDMEITHDKRFNVYYPSMGVAIDAFRFTYPGNIKHMTVTDDATELLNYVTARGQGFGSGQIVDIRQDTASQAIYTLRQGILDYSEIPDLTTLQNLADEEIANLANPFRVIRITLDGNRSPYVGSYGLGDTVHVKVEDMSMYSDIDNTYKIDEINIKIDDDDNEDVDLKLTAS